MTMSPRPGGRVLALVGATAVLVSAGCAERVAGNGSPVRPTSAATAGPRVTTPSSAVTATTATATGSDDGAGGGSGSGSGGSGPGGSGSGGSGSGGSGSGGPGSGSPGSGSSGSGGSGSTAPAFTQASITCVATGTENVPGRGDVPTYTPRLSWTAVRATGVAVSIDNPGVVGSYGSYGPSGSLDLGDGCYRDETHHTITVTTLGGTGPAQTRTVTTPSDKVHPAPVVSGPATPTGSGSARPATSAGPGGSRGD